MAKIDKVLGSISPLYGMASGQGAFANLRKVSPLMYAIGETDTKAEKRRKRKEEEEKKRGGANAPAPTMRKGGKVKKMAKGGKVTRGDGIAKKGHTKGKRV